ncbi:hypothetical protein LJC31_00250 [Synergistaceae bacterium OttesenSCG-928-I11]|nr:hypothetical protein [Synergistaceae bacterium OttesenSCG-928-I11]
MIERYEAAGRRIDAYMLRSKGEMPPPKEYLRMMQEEGFMKKTSDDSFINYLDSLPD